MEVAAPSPNSKSWRDIDAPTLTFLAEHAKQIRILGKRVIGDVIEIGRRLAECKERCGHGNWLPWLETEFGWTDRTALNFMRMYEDSLKSETVSDLPLPMRSLYLLVAPSTPQSARTEVKDRAEVGKRLKHSEVQAIIAGHSPAAVREAFKQIRAESIATRHAEWTAKTVEISKRNSPLPCDHKYPVILADTAWKFEVYDSGSGLERAPETHYPTLSIDEICALPVADLATPDAVLFLWCTSPHLRDGLRVVESWGFTYRANIVWVKQGPPGLGHWVRHQHEILLIGARGNMRAPLESDRPPSVIHAPRREHSRKPDEAYEAIERMYPDLPKAELFARSRRPGWTVWGNEIPSPAAAPSDDGLDIPNFLPRSTP
jgi:N6-adenosine-specific RNA methylase IME4